MAFNISLEKLIQGGAHFGHQVRRWNPKMEEFIYGSRKGVHLFDLTKTKDCLEDALNELKRAAKDGKSILVVGTKKQIKDKVKEIADECSIFYVNERWLGGTLTNFDQIKKSVSKLEQMQEEMKSGLYVKYTKKERLLLEREIQRLNRYFSGLKGMDKLPDLLIIFDIRKERGAVKEAGFKKIETIAVVDSNCDPTEVDFPIPMNDDAKKALEYVLDLFKEAIMEGKGMKNTSTDEQQKKLKKINGESKKN